MESRHPQTVHIIGGGWSGLAAAVTLSDAGIPVCLHESSPQLGGRARTIQWGPLSVDNGQHLMIGAYQQMLQLLQLMEADTQTLFKRLPHHMLMLDARDGSTAFELELPSFPAPLHLLVGVMRNQQLGLLDKFRLLWRFDRLLKTELTSDMSVNDWLASANLPNAYVESLIKPVCLAAMTTHSHEASARSFQSVLRQTFNGPAEWTDLLIPCQPLGEVFPEIAARYILANGGEIHTRNRLRQIHTEGDKLKAIEVDGEQIPVERVILATPPSVTASLLSPHAVTASISQQLEKLTYEPVTTAYLRFQRPVKLPAPMTGIINGTAEWLFERPEGGEQTLLAAVISAPGPQLLDNTDAVIEAILRDISNTLGPLPELLDSKLITDKRATLRCHTHVDNYRPGMDTPLQNLKLCGDYVYIEENNDAGLPSTLEGALRCGVKCAQTFI